MDKMLNKRIYRIILFVLVIASMFLLPSLFIVLLERVGIKDENISYVISLFIYIGALILIYYPELELEYKTFRKNIKESIDTGFKYWLLGLVIMLVSNIIINTFVFKGNIAANEELNRQAIANSPIWYTILSIGFIAPVMEELIFRKGPDKIFNKSIYYCIVSGLLFGFVHVLADLSSALNLLYIIPYGALGFSFALMDSKTNTVFTSILMHATHNMLTLVLLFMIL